MSDNKHMLVGLSDGSLYSISWKGEVTQIMALAVLNLQYNPTILF